MAVLETFHLAIAGAALVGSGALLAALGYKTVRFNTWGMGISLLAGLGCLLGTLAGSPLLAALLTVAGTFAGYATGRAMFYGYVALAGAAGGLALGLLLSILTRHSHPYILMAVSSVGCAVITCMNARVMTILWTSVCGSSLCTLGILSGTRGLEPATLKSTAVYAALLLVAMTILSVIFQLRTTEEEPVAKAKPVRKAKPETAVRELATSTRNG